jgi:hypothetical protein
MKTESPLLPLDTFAAEYAGEGARVIPHANRFVLSADVHVPQPPANDWGDPKLAHGAKALRQPFERRRVAAKNENNKRIGPDVLAERHLESEVTAWRELAIAHDDIARIESNIAAARVEHLAVVPGDAATTILDGERRAYLRGLSLSDRLNAMRADTEMLTAAMRAPTLAGIATDAERERMAEAWKVACDARDPLQAQRLAEFSERVAWSRQAINRAAKVLAAESVTDATAIVGAMDAVDTAKLSGLVATVPDARMDPGSGKLVKSRRFAVLGDDDSTPRFESSPSMFRVA